MRVTLPGRVLRNLVKSAVTVAKDADDRPILRNLLLVATDAGLEITATDTITGLWLNTPVSDSVVVKKAGRAVVNAQNLQRTVDTVANRDVTLVASDRQFRVEAQGSKFRLAVEDPNDFPKIARFSQRKPHITIKADLIPKMVSRTAYCAHDEASFQLMHGMLIRAENQELRMVATNGQRLAVTTLKLEEADPQPAWEHELVIPAEAADVLRQIVTNDTPTIDIQWMSNFLNARTSQGEVSIRALAGSYPLYGRGIPSDLKALVLDRKQLIEILKQTTAIKSPTSNFVSLKIHKDRMVFSSVADGAGDAEVEYPYVWDGDEGYGITINPDFMIDTLACIRGEDVSFEVGNEMTPTILREQDGDDGLKSFCVYAVVRQ